MDSITRGRMTVLIVEGDDARADLGEVVFGEFDLSVRRARTAEEALAELVDRSGEVTVLVADADLPGGMDGLTLARRAAVLWPAMTVIVSAGDGEPASTGCPDGIVYIRKPWRPLDIVAAAAQAARADHSVRAVRM